MGDRVDCDNIRIDALGIVQIAADDVQRAKAPRLVSTAPHFGRAPGPSRPVG